MNVYTCSDTKSIFHHKLTVFSLIYMHMHMYTWFHTGKNQSCESRTMRLGLCGVCFNIGHLRLLLVGAPEGFVAEMLDVELCTVCTCMLWNLGVEGNAPSATCTFIWNPDVHVLVTTYSTCILIIDIDTCTCTCVYYICSVNESLEMFCLRWGMTFL